MFQLSPRFEEERRVCQAYQNGFYEHGMTLYLPDEMTMAELLNAAGRRLNMNAQRVFNSDGHEITDLILIDPNDVLFFSSGENFCIPKKKEIKREHQLLRRSSSAPTMKDGHSAAAGGEAGGDSELTNYLIQENVILEEEEEMEGTNDGLDGNQSSGRSSSTTPPATQTVVTVGGYEVCELLGKGAFGEVYRGVHQVTRDVVALKFLTKNRLTSAHDAQKVFTEIHCLETLNHKHVIKLLGVKNADTHMVLVFEYAGGGDLKQVIYIYFFSRPVIVTFSF
jgi:hypothetical protein